jgi:hypothetical protein
LSKNKKADRNEGSWYLEETKNRHYNPPGSSRQADHASKAADCHELSIVRSLRGATGFSTGGRKTTTSGSEASAEWVKLGW